MKRIRVIPVLQIKDFGLYKTLKYKNPKYIGDPVNAIKIFNEKEVDELAIVDISATAKNKEPNYDLIYQMAGEAFMPLAYGGGVFSFNQAKKIFACGIEKIIINTAFYRNPKLLEEISEVYGSQSVVFSLDVNTNFFGRNYPVSNSGTVKVKKDIVSVAKEAEKRGAGEILLNYIPHDGTYKGYNLSLIRKISDSVNIPIIANCGASGIKDFYQAVKNGASAVAAGSYFAFKTNDRDSILINYPSQEQLQNELYLKF